MSPTTDGLMFLDDANEFMDDYSLMVASDKFAPLTKLYSTSLEPLQALSSAYSGNLHYKPVPRQQTDFNQQQRPFKAAMSPMEAGPRASGGPGSVGAAYRAQASPAAGSKYSGGQAAAAAAKPKTAEANALVLNLVLSDSLFNVFRDHNFDSCTMCVCSNAGNTRGRDAAKYLPKYSGRVR